MFIVNMQNKFQNKENSGHVLEVMLGIRDYSEMELWRTQNPIVDVYGYMWFMKLIRGNI